MHADYHYFMRAITPDEKDKWDERLSSIFGPLTGSLFTIGLSDGRIMCCFPLSIDHPEHEKLRLDSGWIVLRPDPENEEYIEKLYKQGV